MLSFYPSGVSPLIGVPQHQRPFVQGLMVGPTPNPLLLLSNIWLRRYDLPVRYNPATDTTPMGPGTLLINSMASGARTYS
jgi:hypothetical protein